MNDEENVISQLATKQFNDIFWYVLMNLLDNKQRKTDSSSQKPTYHKYSN